MNVIIDENKKGFELTKEFNRMSKVAQNQLNETYKSDVELGINVHLAKCQKHWLMMYCIVNHDYMGMTVEECLLSLANWHEVYRLNSKFEKEADQVAWLTAKMDEIFGVGNYPYQYIDKLEDM